ncbi:cation:proton antiporter [Stenomitos frigidus]|uniref:Sodium:proton antiporter n=1 Tax=Stenomitos frigidus ULC18 TaxID=2107698 RepID=A0A2T1E6K1_9CYAN|nr:sodium:proton antiporter [Stenomitos frigidus]PSB28315.1 sodium:proton antiporter [Stenomitos frigidus ULC18]
MEPSLDITLQIILTVMAGIGAQVLAEFLKLPGIVFLLLFGILLGPSAFGLLSPDRLGIGLDVIVSLLVAVILFEGGFNLELRELGRVSGSLRNLVTIGTLITLLGAGMAAHWLSEFPWAIAFLYGSLVVVTGPTVINPLLRQVKVDRQVAALLEGEGVLIDPVGAILAVVVLNILLNGEADPLRIASGLVIRLGIGGSIGTIGGWLLGLILKQARFLSDDLKALIVLAGLWGLFGAAQTIQSESGLMATVAAGIVLRASSVPEERLLKRFKGQLTILAVSVLFVLLAADLSIAGVIALGWGGVLTVLSLMFIVRPLNVWCCTWNSGLNWRQKLFVCWIGPRGIVSASIASLFAISLTQRGINGGDSIKALVFLTIMLTVFLQALTAQWAANLLQVTSNEATGAVIVGCNPLSLLIARLFVERDEPVTLIDTAAEARQQAEQEKHRIFISSALDAEVLEEAGLSRVGTFLAMTNNGEVNLVVARQAAEEFRPPRVLAIFPRDPQVSTNGRSTTGEPKIQQAFASQMTLKTWNQHISDRAVKLGETVLQEAIDPQQVHLRSLIESGTLLPMLLERQGCLQVVPAEEVFQVGDRLLYLLYDPKPKLLKLLSGSSQTRLTLEQLPEVENLPLLDDGSDTAAQADTDKVLVQADGSRNADLLLQDVSENVNTE